MDMELVETVGEQSGDLGIYESNVIDTADMSPAETVSAIKNKMKKKAYFLL